MSSYYLLSKKLYTHFICMSLLFLKSCLKIKLRNVAINYFRFEPNFEGRAIEYYTLFKLSRTTIKFVNLNRYIRDRNTKLIVCKRAMFLVLGGGALKWCRNNLICRSSLNILYCMFSESCLIQVQILTQTCKERHSLLFEEAGFKKLLHIKLILILNSSYIHVYLYFVGTWKNPHMYNEGFT